MIDDFGSKIGGAKKDLWKQRGLDITDIVEMNDAEKVSYIKKDNIWKKPDYMQLVTEGRSRRIVYFIKTIRDALPIKPQNISLQSAYISFITDIRNAAMQLKQDKDIFEFYENNILHTYVTKQAKSSYVIVNDNAKNLIDNKFLRATQCNNFLSIDRAIDKKMFCYSDEEKVLSRYSFWLYKSKDINFKTDNNNETVIEIPVPGGRWYLYSQDKYCDQGVWQEDTFFITKNRQIIANNFATRDEAKSFVLNQEINKNPVKQPTKVQSQRKKVFVPIQLINVTRNGKDFRQKRDVTGDNYLSIFNFKGGEFGNWLNENDRQQSLNYGYDALQDLSIALKIDNHNISLNGGLSIAFGSRGKGSALAHYETLREVINLTKMKGAGSLAHEWAHALDDYLGKQNGCPLNRPMMSENIHLVTCLQSLKDIMDTMKFKQKDGIKIRTDFYENAIAFDKINAKTDHGYWQSNAEMFARAFACYVKDKLPYRSDYLVGHADSVECLLDNGNMIIAYPVGKEREHINYCFDKLIENLKELGYLHEKENTQEISLENDSSNHTADEQLTLFDSTLSNDDFEMEL